MSKHRLRKIKGISGSGLRLLDRITSGRGRQPKRLRQLSGKNVNHWQGTSE